ncbi:hypothetical protein Hanom_Chr11g01043981 [Helianthus anomalus]
MNIRIAHLCRRSRRSRRHSNQASPVNRTPVKVSHQIQPDAI